MDQKIQSWKTLQRFRLILVALFVISALVCNNFLRGIVSTQYSAVLSFVVAFILVVLVQVIYGRKIYNYSKSAKW